jgi:hypothetical protein
MAIEVNSESFRTYIEHKIYSKLNDVIMIQPVVLPERTMI